MNYHSLTLHKIQFIIIYRAIHVIYIKSFELITLVPVLLRYFQAHRQRSYIGVPQRSFLGPLLFLSTSTIFHKPTIKSLLADDAGIYHRSATLAQFKDTINSYLNSFDHSLK